MSMDKKQNQDSAGDEPIENVPAYKRKRVVIPLLIATAAIGVGAYIWGINAMRYVSTDDSMVEADRITVSAKILGRVATLKVHDEDSVHKGDTLVILDDSDLRLQEQKAQAMVTVQTRNATIANAGLARAQDDFNRAKVQYDGKIISKEQYDHAARALEQSEAQVQLSLAQINSAQADFAIIKNQLANTIICASEAGVFAKHWVQPGDVVSPGQAIYTVFDMKNIWVSAYFEETKLRQIKVGAPVEISVDAYPDVIYKGSVEWLGTSTAAQFSIIPLLPGLSVSVKIITH